MFEIIPAIDILNGNVVRLKQGDYNQSTIYSDNPADFAHRWYSAGATWIHLVDLDGAKVGHPVNTEAIQKIRERIPCQIELGGGIRTIQDVETALKLGVDRIILGSIALKNKPLTAEILKKFGPGRVVIGIDAKNGQVATEGWLENSTTTAEDLLKEMNRLGVQTVIYTDISKDGMLSGTNLAMYQKLVNLTPVKIIASGGIGTKQDIDDLKKITGLAGVIVGKALYENKIKIEELF